MPPLLMVISVTRLRTYMAPFQLRGSSQLATHWLTMLVAGWQNSGEDDRCADLTSSSVSTPLRVETSSDQRPCPPVSPTGASAPMTFLSLCEAGCRERRRLAGGGPRPADVVPNPRRAFSPHVSLAKPESKPPGMAL